MSSYTTAPIPSNYMPAGYQQYMQMQQQMQQMQAAQQKAAATPPPNLTTPTYAQFVAKNGGQGGGTPASAAATPYMGGATPAGMNAADAATLQSIYAPIPAKKADGGFVAPTSNAGFTPQHFALGGMPNLSEGTDWTMRRDATGSVQHNAGLFNSSVPGRTDKLNSLVPAGAYVIPADVVSGLGEGNTMAGSNVLDKMFHTDPYGIQSQHMSSGVGIPHAPAAFKEPKAKGGPATGGQVPIIAAGGEYLVHPNAVKKLGGGDIKRGHKILDHFVVHARNKTANEMKRLPPPKK